MTRLRPGRSPRPYSARRRLGRCRHLGVQTVVNFPDGLSIDFCAAWLACHDLTAHFPGQESDGPQRANAVVRFCLWARRGRLRAAEKAVQSVADSLSKPSLALTLVAACR